MSWKVKIPRDCEALASASSHSHFVRIWQSNRSHSNSPHFMPQNNHNIAESVETLKIVSWNCRGLHNSVPYIQYLIAAGYDVIILEEHWLWPYELNKLKSLNPNYVYTAVSDQRLNSTSDLTRGLGGVAIIWKKSLRASPIKIQDCDRMCGLQVEMACTRRPLFILGVYLPSGDQPQHVYNTSHFS